MTCCFPPPVAGYGDRAGQRLLSVNVARKHGLKTGLHNRHHTHAVLLMQAQVLIKVVGAGSAMRTRR